MSGFIAIASSKELVLPIETQAYYDNGQFDIPNKSFSLSKLDEWEEEGVKTAFTIPYIYNAGGIGGEHF